MSAPHGPCPNCGAPEWWAARNTRPFVAFFTPGVPYPKGSYAPILVDGRLRTKTDKNLETWNSLVRARSRMVMGTREPTDRPLLISLEFVLPRARGAGHASTHPVPDVAPDWDKLSRAVGDAMIKIVYTDDARITFAVVGKRWARAEETTGVHIVVEEVVSQLTIGGF